MLLSMGVSAGVTRRSVLELAREWKTLEGGVPLEVTERRLTMGEIVRAAKEGRVRLLPLVTGLLQTGLLKELVREDKRIVDCVYRRRESQKEFCVVRSETPLFSMV